MKTHITASLRGISQISHPFNLLFYPVSVGQEYHEGKKLSAALRLLVRKFPKVAVLVGDTLQRHNVQSSEETWLKALRDGEQWINRHRHLLAGLEIHRWSTYLCTEAYACAFQDIQNLVATDFSFRVRLQEDCEAVARRWRVAAEDWQNFIERSQKYLLEELAVFRTILEINGSALFAYPGTLFGSSFSCLKDLGFFQSHELTALRISFNKTHSHGVSINQEGKASSVLDQYLSPPESSPIHCG